MTQFPFQQKKSPKIQRPFSTDQAILWNHIQSCPTHSKLKNSGSHIPPLYLVLVPYNVIYTTNKQPTKAMESLEGVSPSLTKSFSFSFWRAAAEPANSIWPMHTTQILSRVTPALYSNWRDFLYFLYSLTLPPVKEIRKASQVLYFILHWWRNSLNAITCCVYYMSVSSAENIPTLCLRLWLMWCTG